jgi:predicted glycoside hydrolase/deacetylase ChbG (UPF0249 family)
MTTGALIINADDWGRDREATDRTRECVRAGGVSSVSAMVFMADADRGADIAREDGIDAGLHLNFTSPFTGRSVPAGLAERQRVVGAYLRHPAARLAYHPGLARAFADLVSAQCEEFARLYGAAPRRLDGHHHMHLSMNVLLARLLPFDTIARRHFSYEAGEKVVRNGVFRAVTNALLARRHRMADYFFSLPPLGRPGRLERIAALARTAVVEVETHPVAPNEHRLLVGGGIAASFHDVAIASSYTLGGTAGTGLQPPSRLMLSSDSRFSPVR